MNVTQFMERLSVGPLSNLSMSNNGDGTIAVAKHPAIIAHLNDVLLRLFTRFDLAEKELIIRQRETQTSYKLSSEFAYSVLGDAGSDDAYIRDTLDAPFTDDLIRVYAVFDHNGVQLPLNDDTRPDSVFTPKYNVLQSPHPIELTNLYALYQARHPELDADNLAAEIDLPAVLEEAAVSFVAHKIYAYMNGQENAVIAAGHLASYETVCGEVTKYDLVNSSLSFSGVKFTQGGFR